MLTVRQMLAAFVQGGMDTLASPVTLYHWSNFCFICQDTRRIRRRTKVAATTFFVWCNFTVRNITFSILIEHVAIEILSPFPPSCSAGSVCLPLTLFFHCFSLIRLGIGLLSSLGKVNSFRKDLMVFHYGLGGFFMGVLVTLGLGGVAREDCTYLSRINTLLSHWLVI